MVGKRKFVWWMMVLVLGLSLLSSGCTSPSAAPQEQKETEVKQQEMVRIGISQIVEHPALDAARNGFVDALKEKGFEDGKNIEIDFQNAQGDIPTAQTIAQNFAGQKKDMILAIATPSAQAAFNVTKEIPILITAVTDPVESGLVKSWEKSGTNVTGTSDATPIEKQFALLKELVPQAKKVGILFNTSEANSEIQIQRAEKIAPTFSLEITSVGVTSVNEIPQALDDLLQKVDVLYIPTDNMIASAMPLVSDKAIANKIPVIGSEQGHVEGGALATEGIDYYELGFETGLVAVEVISGKDPKEMSIQILENTERMINMDTAKKLGIEVSEEVKKTAKIVGDGE